MTRLVTRNHRRSQPVAIVPSHEFSNCGDASSIATFTGVDLAVVTSKGPRSKCYTSYQHASPLTKAYRSWSRWR
jgi:hypothetical protein